MNFFRTILLGITTSQILSAVPSAIMPEQHQSLLNQYCYNCHDSFSAEGEIDLEELDLNIAKDIKTAETWQKVLNVLNSREMPPKDKKQIPEDEKALFLEALSTKMVHARDILSDSGGEITIRRLNRREYTNTMEALLGIRPDASGLPDDNDTGGFDTTGASLFFSSDQFEQYRAIAQKALSQVFRYKNSQPPERQKTLLQAELVLDSALGRTLARAADHRDRADAFESQKEKPPSAFGYSDLAEVEGGRRYYRNTAPQLVDYFKRPETRKGATLIRRSLPSIPLESPYVKGDTGGLYRLTVKAGAYPDTPEHARYIEYGYRVQKYGEVISLGVRKIHGTLKKPSTFTVDLKIPAAKNIVFFIRQRAHQDNPAFWRTYQEAKRKNGIGPDPYLWVDWMEFEGPFFKEWPPKKIQDCFVKKENNEPEEQWIQRALQTFAKKAFRGIEPEPAYLKGLFEIFKAHRNSGKNQNDSFIESVSVILASPSFLYLAEPRKTTKPQPLNSREFANRLSYFLWSTPPDAQLIHLAENGTLLQADVLEKQINRLLKDPQAQEFIEGFVHQWLHLERIDTFQFTHRENPRFDEAVRNHSRSEIYKTFQHILDKDLPLENLLKADFIVINDVLADHYDIPEVKGSEFRSISLPKNSPRGGLLGMAAISIMGSDGVRSSPIERGAWTLRYLLNDPPPPAPANVPMLSRLADQIVDTRELQRLHQEQAQCAQCHRKIDPIGFGLENFDPSGRWRETSIHIDKKNPRKLKYTEFPIDPSGELTDGTKFADFFELRDIIYSRRAHFSKGFAKALIAYSLGRPFSFSDEKLAVDLISISKKQRNTIRSYIHALAHSEAFKTK